MKVPSPGESITEVEIATWLVEDGDYVEKDQAIAEVDSDKATLELPAEASGTITLKAEEGDAVAVGQVVCLIDTSAEKPEGSEPAKKVETVEAPKPTEQAQLASQTYATGTQSPAAKKILAEAGYANGIDEKTGKPLIVYLDITARGPDAKASLSVYIKQFKKIDVQLIIRNTM